MLLEKLRAAIAAGQVELGLEFGRLRLSDSPVVVNADGNLWFIASAGAVALSWLGASKILDIPGWTVGLPVLAVAVAIHFTLARRYIERRIARRVGDVPKDIALWRRLWRHGGVKLIRADGAAPAECRAPDGNWFEFARRLPPPA